MNLSMNEAASHLKIGKTRLYQLVNEHKIEPTQRGRRRELSSEQLDNLKSIINFRVPEPEPSTEPPEPSEHFTLIEELKNQNKILLQQLEREQEDRRRKDSELIEQTNNFQKMLMFLQQDNAKLRNQLLEAPKQEAQFESRKQEPEPATATVTTQEFKAEDISPETIPNRNSRSGSRAFGVGLSVAAIIGVLFYAAITQGGDWLSDSLDKRISAALKVNGTEPDIR